MSGDYGTDGVVITGMHRLYDNILAQSGFVCAPTPPPLPYVRATLPYVRGPKVPAPKPK